MEFDKLLNKITGREIEVHRELGHCLLESIYEQCLAKELAIKYISIKIQTPLSVIYKGLRLDRGYRYKIENISIGLLIILMKNYKSWNKTFCTISFFVNFVYFVVIQNNKIILLNINFGHYLLR